MIVDSLSKVVRRRAVQSKRYCLCRLSTQHLRFRPFFGSLSAQSPNPCLFLHIRHEDERAETARKSWTTNLRGCRCRCLRRKIELLDAVSPSRRQLSLLLRPKQISPRLPTNWE